MSIFFSKWKNVQNLKLNLSGKKQLNLWTYTKYLERWQFFILVFEHPDIA